MIDAVDSYIRYVRLRMASINPERLIKGPMDAQEWPTKQVVNGALYLLTFSDSSGNGTPAVPVYSHMLQWAWIVFGDPLCDDKRGRNRGNRYRVDFQIKDELRRATYPNFAPKVHLTVDNAGTLTATPLDNQEAISWTEIDFGPKNPDKASGVIYGYATTYVTQFTEPIVA